MRNSIPFEGSDFERVGLQSVIAKLCHAERGLCWTPVQAESAVKRYRQWLWLNSAYPDENIPPSQEIDAVWHTHILDTRKYAKDCEMLFGHFLHHNPFSGWESDAAEAQHQENFRRSKS